MKPIVTATILFALVSLAPAQATKVVPSSAGNAGSSSTPYFSGYGAGRCQQVVAGSALCRVTALINEVRLRADGNTAIPGRTFTSLKFWLGSSKATPTTLNANFAANRGTQTLVFNGRYSLPAQVAGKRPFNIAWKLSKSFLYRRNGGDLLLEWEVPGNPTKANYFFDAHLQRASSGSCRAFGTAGQFKAPESYIASCVNPTTLHPGGSAALFTGPFTKSRPAIAIWGFSNTQYGPLKLPFHLQAVGAANNYLHVSIDLALAMQMGVGRGGWEARSILPIPNVAGLAGKTIFAQGLFADAPSNSFGWVWSSGVGMQLAGSSAVEAAHLGHWDSTSATGFLQRTPSGIVIEFVGIFA